jgi:hypothetical protein
MLGSWEARKPAIFFDLSFYQHSSLQASQPSSVLTVSYQLSAMSWNA